MSTFRFSLQKLLDLRQLELQQIESQAAEQAQLAAAWLNRRRQLLVELGKLSGSDPSEARGALAGGSAEDDWASDWMLRQRGAQGIQSQANHADRQRQHCEEKHRELLDMRARKATEVEGLETLREHEREEFQRRQRRREEAAIQEQVLQKWMQDQQPPAEGERSVTHG